MPDQAQAGEDGHTKTPAPLPRPAIVRPFGKLADRISEPGERIDLAAKLQRPMAP